MPVRAQTLSSSVANMRRKLLQMMDALAESGMRSAHREISRASETEPKLRGSAVPRRKAKDSSALH